jgi:hypothetical protein
VARHVIQATEERVDVCDECDATWLNSPVGDRGFRDLTALLEERGLSPLWTELASTEPE